MLSLESTEIDFANYNQQTFNYHKQVIRKHLKIQAFDTNASKIFTENVQDRIAKHQALAQIVHEVAELCRIHRFELPGYN